jgi:hypothetical protein
MVSISIGRHDDVGDEVGHGVSCPQSEAGRPDSGESLQDLSTHLGVVVANPSIEEQ